MTDSGSPSTNHPYIVDDIFCSHEIHLIAGPSGSGKTTFALQIADEWSRGEPIFGHASHPHPFAIVSCERSKTALRKDLEGIGVDSLERFNFASLVDPLRREHRPMIQDAIDAARLIEPNLRVLFLDGLASLCPGKTTDYRDSSNFLLDVARICQERQITIIGTVHSVKSREGDGYASPRDRIAGSAAWSALTETKILVEPLRPSKAQDANRVVTVLPRKSAPQILTYAFRDSRLEPVDLSGDAILQPTLDKWLTELSAGTVVTTQQIIEAARDLSRATVFRWIEAQVDLGTLVRVRRGEYAKAPDSPVQ